MSAPDDIPLPADPKHQRFADLILGGMPAAEAYGQAGFIAKTPASRASGATRLLKNADIVAYMEAVRQRLTETGIASKQEVMRFLTNVIRTSIGGLDENDPMVQELTTEGLGGTAVRRKIKMVSKMDAIDRLSKMLAWYAPEEKKHTVDDALGEILRDLGANAAKAPRETM